MRLLQELVVFDGIRSIVIISRWSSVAIFFFCFFFSFCSIVVFAGWDDSRLRRGRYCFIVRPHRRRWCVSGHCAYAFTSWPKTARRAFRFKPPHPARRRQRPAAFGRVSAGIRRDVQQQPLFVAAVLVIFVFFFFFSRRFVWRLSYNHQTHRYNTTDDDPCAGSLLHTHAHKHVKINLVFFSYPPHHASRPPVTVITIVVPLLLLLLNAQTAGGRGT